MVQCNGAMQWCNSMVQDDNVDYDCVHKSYCIIHMIDCSKLNRHPIELNHIICSINKVFLLILITNACTSILISELAPVNYISIFSTANIH